MQTLCSLGVMMRKEGMHTHISAPRRNALHRTAKPLLLLRLVEIIPLDQCLDVESRAANDERQMPLRRMGTDELRHTHDKRCHRERLIRIQYVDEMMRDTSLLLCRWLCTADVEPAIDAHGVARDDVRPQCLGKLHRQCSLSDRRRSEEHKNGTF